MTADAQVRSIVEVSDLVVNGDGLETGRTGDSNSKAAPRSQRSAQTHQHWAVGTPVVPSVRVSASRARPRNRVDRVPGLIQQHTTCTKWVGRSDLLGISLCAQGRRGRHTVRSATPSVISGITTIGVIAAKVVGLL